VSAGLRAGPSSAPGRVLDPASLTRTSWRNGVGTTRVVACGTRTRRARQASWRVSLADIDGPCTFSLFPDTWRWSLVAAGGGLDLSVDGVDTEVRPGQVVRYSGDSVVRARPSTGGDVPVEVLNLMVTSDGDGGSRMSTRSLDGPVVWSPDVVAVLVLGGTVVSDGVVAPAGLFLVPSDGPALTIADGAHVVEMAVQP
jgi:environmental stress-induced protein Ves